MSGVQVPLLAGSKDPIYYSSIQFQGSMKIFLDTADTDTIRRYYNTGMIDGVTTNPTLIMKSGKCPTDVYQGIKDIGIKDISMEVVGDYNEMVKEGQRLYNRFGNVASPSKYLVLKMDSWACSYLAKEGIKVNVTLIFSSSLKSDVG